MVPREVAIEARRSGKQKRLVELYVEAVVEGADRPLFFCSSDGMMEAVIAQIRTLLARHPHLVDAAVGGVRVAPRYKYWQDGTGNAFVAHWLLSRDRKGL